jgi:uncharacterized protein (TIGR00290 family)
MKFPIQTLVSWSSGKDSAWALHRLAHDERYQIFGLLTTINSAFNRVAMHSTRREVLEAQAAALGLPLWIIPLPWPCSNQEYEAAMQKACDQATASGIGAIAFGDLFLEDIRKYREDSLRNSGLTPLFPIWGADTRRLLPEMIASGLKARIVCVDPNKMPRAFAGRDLDESFLRELPAKVDPCGENGEFHSCVYDGPMFREAVPIEGGEVVERDGFVYADVQLREARIRDGG